MSHSNSLARELNLYRFHSLLQENKEESTDLIMDLLDRYLTLDTEHVTLSENHSQLRFDYEILRKELEQVQIENARLRSNLGTSGHPQLPSFSTFK